MVDREELIEIITARVTDHLKRLGEDPLQVPVGVSARHVHLTREHVELLFGRGYELTPLKNLSQKNQFACVEQLTLIGPKGRLEKVRILGPERKDTQVELAVSDSRRLGVSPPVRTSGDVAGTPGLLLRGPKGEVMLKNGVIIADRHIHMTPKDARWFGVSDKERVNVYIKGSKGGVLNNVVIRVSESARLDFHVDTDDANAFQLAQGQWVSVRKEGTI